MLKKIKKVFSLVLLLLFSCLWFDVFCENNSVFAYTASLSSSGTINLDVSATGNGANVTTDNVVVDSTCPLGYTLSISGPTDSTLYKNGDNASSSMIVPTEGTTASPLPITGDDGQGSSYLGSWGYSTSNSSPTGNFIGLTDSMTGIFTKNAASETGGDTIPVYFGASVSPMTEPGLYKLAESSQGAGDDVITYYLTVNPSCGSYVVRYKGNGADTDTTMSVTHSISSVDQEITLYASNFRKTSENGGTASISNANSYGFAGWSLVQLDPNSSSFKTDLAEAVADGKVYGPNETVVADEDFLANPIIENGTQYIDLYAVWVKSEGNLQGFECPSVNDMPIGSITALTDQRDNNVYAIAKLADGNCWMIENLRLDYEATVGSTNEALSQGYGGVFSGLAEPETNHFTNSTAANSRYISDGSGSIYDDSINPVTLTDIGTNDDPDCRFPRYRNDNTNSDSAINPNVTTANMTGSNQNIYSYGNYYSWAAALANTNYYNSSTAMDANDKTSETANTSICPAGWKLPYGGTTGNGALIGGFSYLDVKLGGTGSVSNSNTDPTGATMSNIYRKFPNNFLYSGTAINSTIGDRGNRGYYWSSTVDSYTLSYILYLNGLQNTVNPGGSNPVKSYGESVRCVILAPVSYPGSY